MVLSAHMDYLSVTVPYDHPIMPDVARSKFIESKPANGYTLAGTNEYGVRVMSNPDRRDMGTHVIMSGSTLATLHEMVANPVSLLSWYLETGGKVSRVDVAIDIIDEPFDINAIAAAYAAGDITTKARKGINVKGMTDDGHTLYVGSLKARKKLLRVYDKHAEDKLKALSERHKRVEFEIHGKPATAMSRDMVKAQNFGTFARSVVSGYVDFPTVPDWQRVFSGSEPIGYGSGTHDTQSGTVKWLMESVTKALAREIALDSNLFSRFIEQTHIELRRLNAVEGI